MNHKNNLSLILASTMVSGMFSAAVNAIAYKFSNTTGNLAVHAVSSKNVVDLEDSDNITLDLSASKTPSQKFAFSVSGDVVNENAARATNNKMAADADTIKDLKAKAVAATEKVNAAAKAGVAAPGNVTTYARAFRDAVEVMAEIRGKMDKKSNAKELVSTVKDLTLAFAKAYAASSGIPAGLTDNKFAANALADGEEDAPNTDERIKRALTNNPGAAGAAANTPAVVGICVGDAITGMAETDPKKYQVLCSQSHAIDGRNDLFGGAAAHLSLANASRVSDAILTIAANNIIDQNAAHMGGAGVGGALDPGSTFLTRRNNPTGVGGALIVIANLTTALQQVKNFNNWMNSYFMCRAKAFLSAAEAIPAGTTEATWLGAGAAKGGLNNADDYGVTVALKKGSDAVAVRKHTNSGVTLGGENGAAVTPIVIEFVPKTVTKDTTVEGTLKITSAGATQKVKIEGVVHKSEENALLAEQDDDSEAEVIWDASIDNEDENMPQSFMRVGQQNDAKKAGKEDEKEIPIKIRIKCCPDQCNIL